MLRDPPVRSLSTLDFAHYKKTNKQTTNRQTAEKGVGSTFLGFKRDASTVNGVLEGCYLHLSCHNRRAKAPKESISLTQKWQLELFPFKSMFGASTVYIIFPRAKGMTEKLGACQSILKWEGVRHFLVRVSAPNTPPGSHRSFPTRTTVWSIPCLVSQ